MNWWVRRSSAMLKSARNPNEKSTLVCELMGPQIVCNAQSARNPNEKSALVYELMRPQIVCDAQKVQGIPMKNQHLCMIWWALRSSVLLKSVRNPNEQSTIMCEPMRAPHRLQCSKVQGILMKNQHLGMNWWALRSSVMLQKCEEMQRKINTWVWTDEISDGL